MHDGCLLFQVSNKKLLQSFFFFSFGASVLYYYQMQFWSNESYHYSRYGFGPRRALEEQGRKRTSSAPENISGFRNLLELKYDGESASRPSSEFWRIDY
jgi:hypothetical protein